MIFAIENPFDLDPLSKLSIAEMEQELDEIMERSGFIIPPRAAALQDELAKRRQQKINLSSLYGKLGPTGGLKRGEISVISAKTSGFSSLADKMDDRLIESMRAYDAALQAEFDAHAISTKIPSIPSGWIERYVKQQLEWVSQSAFFEQPKKPFTEDVSSLLNAKAEEAKPLTATEKMEQDRLPFGLVPRPSGIDPMKFESAKQSIGEIMKQYADRQEKAWSDFVTGTSTKPAFVTARAPTIEDFQKASLGLRDHIFDDSITRMYPYNAMDSLMVIRPEKSYTSRNTMKFKLTKERDIGMKLPSTLNFDISTHHPDFE